MDELLDRAPCGYVMFADDGAIGQVNRTLEEWLGYERGTLIGRRLEKILSVGGRLFYQTHFFPLLKMHGRAEEVYLLLRAHDGENVPVFANAARHERDGVLVNECVFVPMRQRARYEDEILQAKKSAEEANRLKDEFLATVSHELRTPLTSILGWLHMIRSREPSPERLANALDHIERSAQAQSQLVEDLLDVSRIISGKMRLDVQSLEPAALIDAAIESIRPAAEAKKIRLQKILDTSVGIVSGDPGRLQQVVWNLLANAIKFTPREGRVQVRLERVHSSVELTVSDTGAGITPEFLPHVFGRFSQADTGERTGQGGLGLGLAIVRHIVELHGGEVSAYSEGTGLGATFTVLLPLKIAHEASESSGRIYPRASLTDQKIEVAQRLDGIHVLAVDDAVASRELLTAILEQQGARVTPASSIEEALALVREARPDVIISDIGLEGEDGYELISRLRSLPDAEGGKTPAIALTAYARVQVRLRALQSGFQMHIAKPVEPAELVAVTASLAQHPRA